MTPMDELLDVLTPEGERVATKPRWAVHRDGDWHRCVHVWVVGAGAVLLQRRAHDRGSWAGHLDATAAGHLLAGESVEEGLREVEEELGIAYPAGAFVPLGVHRVDERNDRRWNRELQHVFAVRDERPLAAWTDWDRTELAGLVQVAAADFERLVAGDDVPADELDARGRVERRTIPRGEVVPAPYLPVLASELARLVGS